MASLWQKTLFYLGLVDEDEAQPYDSSARPYGDSAGTDPYGYRSQPAPPRRSEAAAPQTAAPERRPGTQPAPQASGEPQRPTRTGTGVVGRRVEPPLTTRRRVPVADEALAEAGVIVRQTDSPTVRTLTDADLQSEIVVARSYSDAQALADHIRSARPVVLDLRKVEPAMVRRLVDFSSGLTYALGGSMRKIGQGVILVTPANVNITRDEKARLSEMGFYQASED